MIRIIKKKIFKEKDRKLNVHYLKNKYHQKIIFYNNIFKISSNSLIKDKIHKKSTKLPRNVLDYSNCSEKMNRRIWHEIIRVIKISDAIFLVLDIRNPIGSWNNALEKRINYLKKKMIIILNKCDLVPTWIISKWLKIFSNKYTVFAFHSNVKHSFGKNLFFRMIRIIREKNWLKKQKVIIGILGYPNVGKSSLINTLKKKKVVTTSPIPGQTKVWQFVKIFNNIFLIDSPGIFQKSNLRDESSILEGKVRLKKKKNKQFFFSSMIKKMTSDYYEEENKSNSEILLKHNFIKNQNVRLVKGGKLDKYMSRNKLISDFITGNIPWYSPIPTKKLATKKKFKFPWMININN